MATRRPIVRVAGRNQQLPTGDALAGVPSYVPVFRGAVMLKVAVGAQNMSIAVAKSGGGALAVGVQING